MSHHYDWEVTGKWPRTPDTFAPDHPGHPNNRPDPLTGMPPEEIALREEIAAHAAAGRHQEREAAADRLAAMIMRRTLPRADDLT